MFTRSMLPRNVCPGDTESPRSLGSTGQNQLEGLQINTDRHSIKSPSHAGAGELHIH